MAQGAGVRPPTGSWEDSARSAMRSRRYGRFTILMAPSTTTARSTGIPSGRRQPAASICQIIATAESLIFFEEGLMFGFGTFGESAFGALPDRLLKAIVDSADKAALSISSVIIAEDRVAEGLVVKSTSALWTEIVLAVAAGRGRLPVVPSPPTTRGRLERCLPIATGEVGRDYCRRLQEGTVR
jgi:hypothetical protein